MSRTRTRKILIGLTSHGDLAGLGPTGYYLPEVAHPWRVFTDAGYVVDLASTAGGEPPVDGVDLTDPVQRAFVEDVEMQRKVRSTPRFADIDAADYDAVLFAGGHGTMWDFPDDPDLPRAVREVYESGGVVAAVCHGPAALVGATLSDGRPLVEGMKVSGVHRRRGGRGGPGRGRPVPAAVPTRGARRHPQRRGELPGTRRDRRAPGDRAEPGVGNRRRQVRSRRPGRLIPTRRVIRFAGRFTAVPRTL